MPGWWFGPGVAVLADAHVAGRDAHDAPVLLQQLRGGEAGVNLDPLRLGLRAASQRTTSPSETMKLPWLRICGGVGSRTARLAVRNTKRSSPAGVASGAPRSA